MTTNATHTVQFDLDLTANSFSSFSVELYVVFTHPSTDSTRSRTVEFFVDQQQSHGVSTETAMATLQAAIGEANATTISAYVVVYATTATKAANTLKLRVQATTTDPTGRTYTLDDNQNLQPLYRVLHDFTSRLTMSGGTQDDIIIRYTPGAAESIDGVSAYVVLTFSTTATVGRTDSLYWFVGQDANDDDATLSQAMTMTIGGAVTIRGGHMQVRAINQSTAKTAETLTPTIDSTDGPAADWFGGGEVATMHAMMDPMLVLTRANLESSHTYKSVTSTGAVTQCIWLVVTVSAKITSKTVNVKEDVAQTNVANAELALFKRTAGTPDTWEVMESVQADASGNHTFDFFDAGDYVVGSHQEGATIRADLSNIIAVA